MRTSRNPRPVFRPMLGDGALEARIVLSGARSALVGAAAVPARVRVSADPQGNLTARQLRTALTRELRAATRDARQAINAQIGPLYAGGRPTQQQLADFRASVEGIIGAAASRLSSAAALLPNGSSQLVPTIQSRLTGDQPNSLTGRIDRVTQTARATRSPVALRAAISTQIDLASDQGIRLFNSYLSRNNLN